MRWNFRLRIAAVIAVACMGIVAALGAVLYEASEQLEEALTGQVLTENLDFLVQYYQSSAGRTPPAPGSFQYYAISPAEESRLPDYLQGLDPGIHEIDTGANEWHVALRDAGDRRFVVVYDGGPYEARELHFKELLLACLAVAFCAAPLFGYWLAGLVARQLTRLADEVAGLVPGDPHAPLARAGQDPEIAALAGALDGYQARILDMLKREQEFTANASHELRTPLTAISTSCELLAVDAGLSPRARERVAQIRRAADGMAEQVRALLLLARGEELASTEPVALAECVDDALAPMREELAKKGVALTTDIPADAVIQANRQALQLVLGNLIGNAVRYTEAGSIQVSYAAGRLIVADSGVGIAREQLPRIFERSYRGDASGGLGLGLDIVRRICSQAHWDIAVSSAPSQGSRFVVTFS